jgi:anaerobic ribonucleoside-triphosphate reductase
MKKEKIEKVAETKVESKKTVGEGVGFERIRRITGYLVGTVERFNDGKKAEEHDRVKHTFEK